MAGFRINRVSEDIKREITAILRELKDPRVMGKMLTVVRVEVSSDASYAKVYVSDIKGIDSAKEAVKGLTAATGYLENFELYLSMHFPEWLEKFANTPENITAELRQFAEMII